jgi:dolichol-phosphate mannosyltransferase
MPQLTVVVPAYRERDNIAPLLDALGHSLEGCDWETIVVVDDSDDDTDRLVRERAQQDPRVRCLHRVGRRGLASALRRGNARELGALPGGHRCRLAAR